MIRVIDETGPAEAATSPGRGSNNSGKESAVNDQTPNMAAVDIARQLDFSNSLHELFLLASIGADLAEEIFGPHGRAEPNDVVQIEALRLEIEKALFIFNSAETLAKKLKAEFVIYGEVEPA